MRIDDQFLFNMSSSYPAKAESSKDDSTTRSLPIAASGDFKISVEDGDKQQALGSNTKRSAFKSLGLLDRFLALWIFLAILIGILLGNFVPKTGPALQKGTFVGISIPIAVGLLIMMYPILCKVKIETLHLAFRTREIWTQIFLSVFLN